MRITDPAYFTAFKNFEFSRTPSGVLTFRFHVRQRLSRRMAEAYLLGSALEGLTGADLAYQQR